LPNITYDFNFLLKKFVISQFSPNEYHFSIHFSLKKKFYIFYIFKNSIKKFSKAFSKWHVDVEFNNELFKNIRKPNKNLSDLMKKYDFVFEKKSKILKKKFIESLLYSNLENIFFEDLESNNKNIKVYYGKLKNEFNKKNFKSLITIVENSKKHIDLEFRLNQKECYFIFENENIKNEFLQFFNKKIQLIFKNLNI